MMWWLPGGSLVLRVMRGTLTRVTGYNGATYH